MHTSHAPACCDLGARYLTGKPMPAHVALAALRENLYAGLLPAELRARVA